MKARLVERVRAGLECLFVLSVVYAAASWLCIPSLAHAEDSREQEARVLFESGIQKSAQGRWDEAALLFERSRALHQRPATVFNLLIAYDNLQRYLDIVRTARELFAATDPVRHKEERQRALEFEARAYTQLGRIRLSWSPEHAQVLVDDLPGVFANDGALLLPPGVHRLMIEAPGFISAHRSVRIEREHVSSLSVQLAQLREPLELLPLGVQIPRRPWIESSALRQARERSPAVLGLVLSGAAVWLAAGAVQAVATIRAQRLGDYDAQAPGYLSAGRTYVRTRRSVGPLAFAGSSLAGAGTLLLGDRPPRSRALVWTAGALTAGGLLVGVALAIAEPGGIPRSGLDQPRRELGMWLASSTVPGITWLTSTCWNWLASRRAPR